MSVSACVFVFVLRPFLCTNNEHIERYSNQQRNGKSSYFMKDMNTLTHNNNKQNNNKTNELTHEEKKRYTKFECANKHIFLYIYTLTYVQHISLCTGQLCGAAAAAAHRSSVAKVKNCKEKGKIQYKSNNSNNIFNAIVCSVRARICQYDTQLPLCVCAMHVLYILFLQCILN